MEPVSSYHKEVCHKLFQQGLRLGDYLEVYPAIGKKKFILLNRTKLDISSSSEIQNINFAQCSLKLPNMNNQRYCLELKLVRSHKENSLGEESRYYLKSNLNMPFRVNGVFSFQCFLERGDIVEFGYHKLKFTSKNKACGEMPEPESEHQLNDKMIKSMISILIEGETGTGKTRLAKIIHEQSGRSGRFVHLNLSSFSQNLIESELFGHKKGSFTGAISDKCGAIKEANYGTLFLDEIDSLSKELQTKLLIFLDNGYYRSVGGDGEKKSNIRVIFASGSHLKTLVNRNEMRKDFYFRVSSGMSIQLSPLRKSINKIRSLCHDFALDKNVYLSEALVDRYTKLKWPGNIRQLLGHLNKKVILEGGDKIVWNDCDEGLKHEDSKLDNVENEYEVITMDKFKRRYVETIYRKFDYHLKDTAKALKLAPNTVRSMLQEVA